jgi:uncharacterized caspase-like protein
MRWPNAERTGEQETVFFFYCGHGALGADGEYYLVSHDARLQDGRVVPGTGVSEGELLARLRQIKAQRMLLVFNACFAGSLAHHHHGLPGATEILPWR